MAGKPLTEDHCETASPMDDASAPGAGEDEASGPRRSARRDEETGIEVVYPSASAATPSPAPSRR